MDYFTPKDAAAYLGITRDTLYYHLRKGHLTRVAKPQGGRARYLTREALDAFKRSPYYRKEAAVWAEITRRYHAGESAPDLAAEFGVAAISVSVRAGSRRSYLDAATWAEILRRSLAGEVVAELAREYGVTAGRIYERRRKARREA